MMGDKKYQSKACLKDWLKLSKYTLPDHDV
jgi:hypothetical protein